MVTGIRGLCNGLGPAMFGLVFHVFNVKLNSSLGTRGSVDTTKENLPEVRI